MTSIDRSRYKVMDSSISQKFFSFIKMLSMKYSKNIRVEDDIKESI